MSGPCSVTLVRHGETEWSRSGRHTGRTDLALTALGEEQARAVGPALCATTFDHVLTSPALRARQTCALSGILGIDFDVEVDPDFAEWDYGDYEGRTSTDIRIQRPGWTVYGDGCPGGEDAGDISERADRVIARLRAIGGNIVVFSHGQFACSLAARWIGLAVREGMHLQLGTGCLGVLGQNPSHPDVAVLARWNLLPPCPMQDGHGSELDRIVVPPTSSGLPLEL